MDENPTDEAAEATELTALPTAEELVGMEPEQVQEALDAVHAEAAELRDIDPAVMSDEQADRLVALADFADAVRADTERRQTEAAERAERVRAANERLDGDPGDDGEAGDGDQGDEGGDSDQGDGDAEGDTQAIAASAGARAPRAPARTPARSRVRDIATRRTTQDPRPAAEDEGQLLSIVAAAEGTGFSGGTVLRGTDELAQAFMARSRSFPEGRVGTFAPLQVARLERNFDRTPDGLYQGNPDFADDFQVLVAAANERRLPGGSLVASVRARENALASGQSLTAAGGGWCAPSTTQYGMCQAETLDGIWEGPEVGVPRGGINFTEGPDFADIYTSAGFSQTEAEAIAGETKDCVEITCPDFDEVRLDAVGICVRAPLLTRAAYPELIERWVNGTVVANAHKVGARVVSQISTLLGASASWALTGTPITWGLLTALEYVVEQQRTIRRLSRNDTWEVVLPHWAPLALRADLANRNGIDERSVTRAQVMQHFTDRQLAPQFVYGLQDLGPTATTIPSTITALVYPAGTFVKGTQDVITLDAVYDHPSLIQNMYTAAFAEDGVLVAKMCPGGAKVTVPALATGQLGAANLNDPWGTTQS